MPSQVRRLIENSRERFLSSDLNDVQALAHRAMIEMAASMLIGDLFGNATPVSGVLGGFLVDTASPASMLLSVSPGIALHYTTPAPTTYDSEFVWMEMASAASLDLTADVPAGAGEEVWAVVELAAADALEASDLRDVFDPALGTFSSVNLEKIRGSAPTLRVRLGTATTGVAQLPAGVTGYIPLAYVFLENGDTTIPDENVVRCRPILDAQKGITQQAAVEAGQSDRVSGGGISTANPFDDGDSLDVHDCRTVINGLPARISGGIELDSLIYETGLTFGGDVDSTSTPVYLYMIAPPWPSGYDEMAPRELVFLYWEKTLLSNGPAGTNASNRLGIADGYVRNCIPMFSLTPPEDVVTSGGFDHSNSRGPHPATDSGLVIASGSAWGTGTTVDSVYVGAVARSGATPNATLGQEYLGGGVFRIGSATQSERPLVDYNANQATADHAPFEYPNPASGSDPDIFPASADMAWLQLGSTDGASAVAAVSVEEQGTGSHGDSGNNGLKSSSGFSYTHQAWMRVDANRSVGVTVTGYTSGDHYLATIGYRDRILARR